MNRRELFGIGVGAAASLINAGESSSSDDPYYVSRLNKNIWAFKYRQEFIADFERRQGILKSPV